MNREGRVRSRSFANVSGLDARGRLGIRRLIALLLAAMALAAASSAPRAEARGLDHTAVTRWVERMLAQVQKHSTNPPQASRQLATLSVSIWRALERSSSPRHRSLSRRLVIAGAGRYVLDFFYAEEPGAASSGGRGRRAESLRAGARAGRRVVERHSGDQLGVQVTIPDAYPEGPDPQYLWVPTPPAYQANPLEPAAGAWRTWRIRGASGYVPGPPPSADPDDPSHPRFRRQLREVYDVSLGLTDYQRKIAAAWAGGPGTVTPPGMWNEIAIRAIEGAKQLFPLGSAAGRRHHAARSRRVNADHAALLFATLNAAQADAFIVAWLTKYTYWSPRPITYIRTSIDADWETAVPTPPFPSYVSGHSTVSGAAVRVLAKLLPKHATEIHSLGRDATISRLYGGIHYAADNEVGYTVGRQVAIPALDWYSRVAKR